MNWVEDKLVAAERVFLPSIELVENGQRNALLEATTVVTRQSYDVAGDLETKRNIEIFGNVAFGPKAYVAVFLRRVADGLNSLPAQESIVSLEVRC